jgi:hypothetical protein
MRMHQLAKLVSFLSVLLFWHYAHGAKVPDNELVELYGTLLQEHTYEGQGDGLEARMVDYPALAGDERWSRLIALLANYPEENLDSLGARKAFYLNAYNILAMDMVMSHWPLRSLRSVGSLVNPVWKHDAGVAAGKSVTLSYLEHDVLRAMGDPRVHMAINCASLSCPDLRHEPYQAAVIDRQLDNQVSRFLKQDYKGSLIDTEGQRIRLSSIFAWFEEDFESAGGIESFVRRYRPDLPEAWDMRADLPYNWGVNGELSAHTLRVMRNEH